MEQLRDNQLQIRKLFLDFYSSEINAHSRLVIGFTVIMFTIVGIRQNIKAPIALLQYLLLYCGIFLAALAFWYVLFRLIGYGVLSNAVLYARIADDSQQDVTRQFISAVENYIEKIQIRILIFPTPWFTYRKQRFGFFVCIFFSAVTTCFLYLIIN